MALLNKIFLITDIYLFDEKDTINNFKNHYEIFSKEKNKKKFKFDGNNKNKNEKEEKNLIKDENNKTQNLSLINNNIKKSDNNSKVIKEKAMTEKDLFDYFKHTIACNGALSIMNNKLAIFIDNYFSKVSFIEVPINIKATTLSYEIKPYPKLSHSNVDIVKFYKDNLRNNKNLFKSIFYAGILNKIFFANGKNFGLEVLYSAYLTGYEILRRMLGLMVNGIPFPENPKFYIVKINNNEVNEYIQQEYYNKKENKFVLDCTNLEKSKLKYYVPLFDYNLNEFFGNKLIHKELINKGFINTKGFINYDPFYIKEMGSPKKMLKNTKFLNPINLYKKKRDTNHSKENKKVINNIVNMRIKLPSIQYKVKK